MTVTLTVALLIEFSQTNKQVQIKKKVNVKCDEIKSIYSRLCISIHSPYLSSTKRRKAADMGCNSGFSNAKCWSVSASDDCDCPEEVALVW